MTENPGEGPVQQMQAEGTEEIIMTFISSYLHQRTLVGYTKLMRACIKHVATPSI